MAFRLATRNEDSEVLGPGHCGNDTAAGRAGAIFLLAVLRYERGRRPSVGLGRRAADPGRFPSRQAAGSLRIRLRAVAGRGHEPGRRRRRPAPGGGHAERLRLGRAQHRAGDVRRHRLSREPRRRQQVALQGPLRPQAEVAGGREGRAGPRGPSISSSRPIRPGACGSIARSPACGRSSRTT